MIIETNLMETAWKQALKKIILKGDRIVDERKSVIRELLNLTIKVNDPLHSKIPKFYPLKIGGEKYEKEFLDPNKGSFDYTYGNRLRGFDWSCIEGDLYIDQVEEAIRKLQTYLLTRRATMVTWCPPIDNECDEVPCCIMIDFKYRYGKLHVTGIWRSHDIWGAYPTNWMALKKLGIYVADSIGAPLGTITTQSISAHIYKVNWEEAERAYKDKTNKVPKMVVKGC